MYFMLDFFQKSNIIMFVGQTLRNSVTVARQTLTLFVGVRIPIPQPKNTTHLWVCCVFSCLCHRDANPEGSAKQLQMCDSICRL